MISAVKSLNANFKYDITNKKLELYPTTGKFDFIISSFSKDCGHYKFKDNYKMIGDHNASKCILIPLKELFQSKNLT